ncbi:MAG: GAF domain-containing protein, partial [Candidatus Zixiibacteriota bacterium]
SLDSLRSEWAFAAIGVALGIAAPIGWQLLHQIFYADAHLGFFAGVYANLFGSSASFALFLYMGVGTSFVLGACGRLIGRGIIKMRDRAEKLDRLNFEIAVQKEKFEQRFQTLNSNLKNFHSINTHIQKSLDIKEVLHLAADGLHDILGYDRVNVLMVNREKKCFEFIASRGGVEDKISGITLPLDVRAGAVFKAFEGNRLLLVDDVSRLPREFHLQPPCDKIHQLRSKNFILCPISVRNEVVGLFGVDNKLRRLPMSDTDVDTVKLFAVQVSSTIVKINLLRAAEKLTDELESTFSELLGFRSEHNEVEEHLRQATLSTAQSITEIARGAEIIQGAVDSTRSSSAEISVSIKEVSRNLEQLNEFMDATVTSMTQISSTIKSVEENSQRSHDMAEIVRQQAEDGVDAVIDNLTGLQGISASVGETAAVIGRLAEKSEEIGHITEVITEITQKTNLLALNAAIIAAQAGEHGLAFGVVAEEVRSLAREAAASTGAIGKIIDQIQDYTRESVNHVNQTKRLVDSGINLGETVESSLQQIQSSSQTAMDMTQEIRKSTREVSRAVDSVSRSVESLGGLSSKITGASREQTAGIQSIVRSIENVVAMSDEMASATENQKSKMREIDEAVQSVREMAQRIFFEIEARQSGSREVIEQLEQLKHESAQ